MGLTLVDKVIRGAELITHRSAPYYRWIAIRDDHGVLRSVSHMTPYRKILVTSARNYIFGNLDQGSGPPPDDRKYYEHWRNPKGVAASIRSLDRYVGFNDRCVIVPGYF
jgi:hypothetical protein